MPEFLLSKLNRHYYTPLFNNAKTSSFLSISLPVLQYIRYHNQITSDKKN